MSDEINRINPTVVEGAEDIHGAETFDADYSPLNRPAFSWRDNMAQSRRTLDKKQVGDMMKMRRMGKGRFDAQGYNDKLDESMGMSNRESSMKQSMKDRRDESKGMEKGMGRRAYQRVGTMDAEGIGSILGNVIPEPHFVGFEEIQREKMKNQNTKDAEGCGNCGSALVMNAEGEHGCGCGTKMKAEETMLGSIGEGNDFGQMEAETFEARSRRKSPIRYKLFQDPSFREKLSFGPSNPSYGGYIGYEVNPYAGEAVGLNLGYYSYGRNIKTGEQWEQWAKGQMTPEQFEEFETGVEDGMDISPDKDYSDYDGGLVCGCGATATIEIDKGNVHTCPYCFGVMVGKAKVEIPIIEEAISENMGAEEFGAERRYRYGNRYITRDSKGRFKKNVSVGRSLSADRRRKAKTVKGVGQGGSGDYGAEETMLGSIGEGNDFGQMEAEGDYVVVKRPHHMARVRKDRAVYDPQWNKPNMHTDMNKEGKMYDEKIGGWVDMNFDDGDVVDLTQGVLAKGGIRVGGMTASAIVLAIAGLSGYYYARR